MLFGRVSRKFSSLIQNKLQQIQLSDMTELQMALVLLSDETEKRAFWQQPHQILVQTG